MCLLYISIHDGDWETEAHMFTTVVSMNSEEIGGVDAGRMDYVIQRGLAYFCREGMFVLLMIKFPSLHRSPLSKYEHVLRGSKRVFP